MCQSFYMVKLQNLNKSIKTTVVSFQIHHHFIVNKSEHINNNRPFGLFLFYIKCISDNNHHTLHNVSAALLPLSETMMLQKKHTANIILQETGTRTESCTEPWLKWLE